MSNDDETPAQRAKLDQETAESRHLVNELLRLTFNSRIAGEEGFPDDQHQIAQDLGLMLWQLPQPEAIRAIVELLLRHAMELTRPYATMAEFQAAMTAGEIVGYSTEELAFRDLPSL